MTGSLSQSQSVNIHSIGTGEFLGTATLENGVAFLTVMAPSVGYNYEVNDRIIRAYYSGDDHCHPSNAEFILTIQPGSGGPVE